MKKQNSLWTITLIAAFVCAWPTARVSADAPDEVTITKPMDFTGFTPPTPITVTGFGSEEARVLDFDLTVMGFKEVPAGQAQYTLTGSGTTSVQAQLTSGSKVIFSKLYSGANTRAQSHRLADDVVMQITGKRGIAETKVAFKSSNSGRGGEIYVSDFDGFNRQAVTRDNVDVAAPCWVPGKLALYYTSYKLGYPNVFFQNLSTAERRNFAHYGGMNSSAAVSAQGDRVAMILSKGGSPNVYVCDADGSNLKQLTRTEEASSPCWSPDGNWICFAARVQGHMALYKVPSMGGEMQRSPTSGIATPSEPDWSPDGRWIAFTSHMGGFQICVVPASGGSATPVTAGEDPSWSPNSRTLIFVRRGGDGNRMLSLLDVPTKQVKDAARVSGSNSGSSQPSWAR